jgi:hypothetical protein
MLSVTHTNLFDSSPADSTQDAIDALNTLQTPHAVIEARRHA